MKYKIFLVCFVILKTVNSNFAQNTNDSIIYWTKCQKLKWRDYLGDVPDSALNKNIFALTCSSISIKFNSEFDVPNYKILVYFNKKESWTRDTNSNLLLIHEQLHFDIRELYARKIRMSIEILSNKKESDVLIFDKIITNLFSELDKTQNKYDLETKHGANNTKQKEWNLKISKGLKELGIFEIDYSKYLEDE